MREYCPDCQHGGCCCTCGRGLVWAGMSWYTHHNPTGARMHTALWEQLMVRLVTRLRETVYKGDRVG